MATKTLRVTLADILGPAGPAGRVSGEVWADFVDANGAPRLVRYTDGTVVVQAKARQTLNADGYVDFVVVPSDDATIHADDQGFGVRVGWDLTVRGEHGSRVPVKNAGTVVQVVTADTAVVQFGAKAPYVPVIPGTSYPTSGDVAATYETKTNVATGLAGKRTKGSTITPDDFTGSDRDRLQAAVNYCTANGYPTIVLDRMLTLTGAAPVSIDKAVWSVRNVVTFEGSGGGIIKHDAGTVFTSATANTGDITTRGVKFVSTAGAGTVLWDGDKLIRMSHTENEYHNWDRVFSQTTVGRYAQSVRFHKEHIVGGTGPAITFRESYDVTIDDCLFEDRTAGVWNSDGTITTIANRQLRITKNVMENMAGVPIKLAYSWGCLLQANYFEFNGAATDPQIDLATLAASARQRAVTVAGNQVQQTTAQKAAKVGAILMSTTNPAGPVVSTGNVMDSGIMWQFAAGTTGTVIGTGDYVENSGYVVYPGQDDRYLAPLGQSGATTARPKSPVIGRDVYFDTTLGKPVWPKTAGTPAAASLLITAGATTSGTLTLTMLGTAYNVAVTAGDTITQVRDKIVAAATTFFPTWKTGTYLTTTVMFTALQRGLVSGSLTFNAGGTGVTQGYFGIDNAGTNPVWVDAAGTTV